MYRRLSSFFSWLRPHAHVSWVDRFREEASQTLDKKGLMQLVAQYAGKVSPNGCAVYFLDRRRSVFTLAASDGNWENAPHIIGLESDLVLRLAQGELLNRPRGLAKETTAWLNQLAVSTLVPMVVKERLLGFLVLPTLETGYQAREQAYLIRLSQAAGTAAESILLYREISQQMRALQEAYDQLQQYVQIVEHDKTALEKAYLEITQSLVTTLEARDAYTRGHSDRVSDMAVALAKEIACGPEELAAIRLGSQLHDIGKIGTRDHVLLKQGALTVDERIEMNRHVVTGADILSHLGFLANVVPIIRGHHERWDGTGYPDELAGEAIPLGARIIAIVDAYDAMTTTRPYRVSLGHERAVAIIREGKGQHFDPQLVEVFIGLIERERDPSQNP